MTLIKMDPGILEDIVDEQLEQFAYLDLLPTEQLTVLVATLKTVINNFDEESEREAATEAVARAFGA